MQPQPTKKRVLFIDAMRGFTMFVVVLGHVFVYGLGYGENESVISSIFITFQMPLFFFISGYIGFKAIEKWNSEFYRTNLAKKAITLLIPTAIFFIIWGWAFDKNIVDTFLSTGATVYWFTEVLFEMFVVYFSIAFLSNCTSRFVFVPTMIAIALVTVYILSFCFTPNQITGILSLRAFCRYFQYFCLGLLCQKYNDKFISIVTQQKAITIIIVLFLTLLILMWCSPFGKDSFVYKLNHDLAIRYTGLFLVFSIFAKNSAFFDENGRISRTMQFVGRRTLDIFLIHYFFLPNIRFLKPTFISNNNVLLEFLLSSTLAIAIIAICLAISSIIRNSDFLAKYLFGVSTKKMS